ncbi:MAG: long-chain fatty acid--CoA ligase [Deltaproteobacteria bacterium]|nr:long-chain fatty acid--CoA ligase [Deltaproteobacteria bacterium]
MREKPWLASYAPHVPAHVDYPPITIPQFLLDTKQKHPHYIATTFNDADITYGELNAKANGMAHALAALGVRKGDHCALFLPNTPTYVIAYYAVLKIGAVVVNINVGIQGEELADTLNISNAGVIISLDVFIQNIYKVIQETPVKTVILHSVFGLEQKMTYNGLPVPLIFNDLVTAHAQDEPEWACRPDDPAVLQFTSGSTGAPKAAILTHKTIVANIMQTVSWINSNEKGNDAVLCIIPFFHVFGMNACMNLSVRKGYRMILVPRFDWLDLLPLTAMIEKYRPISLPAVPGLWTALLISPRTTRDLFSSLQVSVSGGAPLPAQVHDQYEALTGQKIYEAYGLSEASSAALFAPYPQGAPRGSIGLPLPDTDARIVDIETGTQDLAAGEIGELAIRGPQIMQGYYGNEALTKKALRDGWLLTGDLARMDDAGFFYLVDRKDDLIITSGFNVYPSSIENILAKHPAVKEAAVIGTPDRIRGQAVTAYIVLNDGQQADREEILAFCRESLPDFKVPRTIHFVDRIPRNPIGKPLKKVLRAEGDKK